MMSRSPALPHPSSPQSPRRSPVLGAILRIWALPYTLLGIFCGLIGLATGGKYQLRRGILEFYGGGTAWILSRLPNGHIIVAMTLGHSILGKTADALEMARDHEHVHIGQFERWGPLMGPAYLGASAWVWLRGGRAYRDNPFEREAYDADDARRLAAEELGAETEE